MAKRKKRSYKRKANKNNDVNLTVIGTIVFSVLLAVLLYTNSGPLGQKLNEILGGLMGILRYILPVGSFAIAIKIACVDEEDYITKKLVQYSVLIICIAIIMSIYQISKGALIITGDTSQIIKRAYILGVGNSGGGAIGALAAVLLTRLLGIAGATVLSVGISIMLFAFVCGIDISELISSNVSNHIERKEEKKIQKQEIRRKQKEYMAARREELRAIQKEQQNKNEKNAVLKTAQEISPEQIKINLNGRIIDEENKGGLKSLLKKSKENKEESNKGIAQTASTIMVDKQTGEVIEEEPNLFVQQEEEKQEKTKQVLQLQHSLAVEEDNYIFPPVGILAEVEKASLQGGTEKLKNTAAKLQKTLYSFGVSAKVENVTVGPAITRYELKPAEGVRVSKIANLADDIALNLAAETIRIEAPIPGKQAVGIEVPNKEKEMVGLREVIESEEFKNNKSKLSVALRKRCCRASSCCKYCKNATCTNCRKYRFWKICMYKYNNYKYSL